MEKARLPLFCILHGLLVLLPNATFIFESSPLMKMRHRRKGPLLAESVGCILCLFPFIPALIKAFFSVSPFQSLI
jgi:hypothetical protein